MSGESEERSLETLQEAVHELHEAEHRDKWLGYVALISGLIAAFAAVVGLFETQATSKTILAKNEAILLQSKASDQWNFFQAKGIKGHIYEVNQKLFPEHEEEFGAKVKKYADDKAEIEKEAKKLESEVEEKNKESEKYFEQHHAFSFAETFLHISIALASISALTRRKQLLVVAVVLSVCGAAFFIHGIL
jgi:hypothetical protein